MAQRKKLILAVIDGLTPEQLNRAAQLAAQRIESTSLTTALTTPSQPSK